MDKEKELLSKEELALMRGGFGVEGALVSRMSQFMHLEYKV